MAYTITITSNSPQALAFVKEAKKLDFAVVTKTKETKEKAPAKAKAKAGLAKPEPRVYNEQKKKFKKNNIYSSSIAVLRNRSFCSIHVLQLL